MPVRALAAALCLLLAIPASAQDMAAPERARLLLPDGRTVAVDGGCWLSTARCIAAGKDMAALRAERDALRESVMRAERERWLLFGLGVGGGALAAWGVPQLLRLLFPPPPPAPAR